MIDLDFAVEGVEIARGSAVPVLGFTLRVSNKTPELPVEHVGLQAQIRIEATHRNYSERERERLVELFGGAGDWDRSLRGLLWANASVTIPAFAEACTVELPVPCTYDFEIAATKYFDGVEQGEAPLLFLFSGAVFYRNSDGDLQISQIAHHKEAGFRLPVTVWQSMMQRYYPDGVWQRIGRDVFDEVDRYKRRHGLASWDEALRRLVDAARAEAV
jgi:hypothetical protein